jgi:ribosomal protein L6P/L9E
MIDPFKKASRGYDHILVAVDKFTSWMEVKPIKDLIAAKAVEFIAETVHRFGVPNRIITNLGTNFTRREFQNYYDDSLIKVAHTSIVHPRANGQVKRSNGAVLEALKKRIFNWLKKYATCWLRELRAVIWGLWAQPSRATGQTPFVLVFGFEAVFQTDLMFNAPRVYVYDENKAEEARIEGIDNIEEGRLAATIEAARYAQALRQYHDKNVQERAFCVADLVLQMIQNKMEMHKLSDPWEGPFIVKKLNKMGAYKIMREDSSDVTNSWNIEHLRRF